MVLATLQSHERPTHRELNPRGVIDVYLSEISRTPVLSPEALERVAAELVERTRAYRDQLHAMPGVAALMLREWRRLKDAGRNPAVLSEHYRDGTGGDPGAVVDAALSRVETLIARGKPASPALARALASAELALPRLDTCYRELARRAT